MCPPLTSIVALCAVICFGTLSGCNSQPPMTPAETSLKLLSIHGLLGRAPQQRSKTAKETLVSKQELNRFFTDLDNFDKFSGELFTGIILGALARNQSRLMETRKTTTASVTAGNAIIHFELVDDTWKINLDKTIPESMKKKAKEEKKRYEAAKAAGSTAQGTFDMDS